MTILYRPAASSGSPLRRRNATKSFLASSSRFLISVAFEMDDDSSGCGLSSCRSSLIDGSTGDWERVRSAISAWPVPSWFSAITCTSSPSFRAAPFIDSALIALGVDKLDTEMCSATFDAETLQPGEENAIRRPNTQHRGRHEKGSQPQKLKQHLITKHPKGEAYL